MSLRGSRRATSSSGIRSTGLGRNNKKSSTVVWTATVTLEGMEQVHSEDLHSNNFLLLGKTILMQAAIERIATEVAGAPIEERHHLLLVCVWQPGAWSLLQEYRNQAASLPQAQGLEVLVLTREELLRMFRVSEGTGETTTFLINAICINVSRLELFREVYLLIDECWITVPKSRQAHITLVINCSSSSMDLKPVFGSLLSTISVTRQPKRLVLVSK